MVSRIMEVKVERGALAQYNDDAWCMASNRNQGNASMSPTLPLPRDCEFISSLVTDRLQEFNFTNFPAET